MRLKAAVAVAALALAAVPTAAAAGTYEHVPGGVGGKQVPACEYEDGSGQELCLWVGKDQGNGKGKTYIVHDGGTDNATYIYLHPSVKPE